MVISSLINAISRFLFILSGNVIFPNHEVKSWEYGCAKSDCSMCHVSAKHCRSTTLGISVVTLNLRLHDIWSQNRSVEKQALPVSRNGSLFQAGVANDSDRMRSYFIISNQKRTADI